MTSIVIKMTAAICLAFLTSSLFGQKTAYSNESVKNDGYIRSSVRYDIPKVQLIRKDGVEVSLIKELNDGRPVLINFIFTSCTAICPMLGHLFSVVENKLNKKQAKFHLVSISIDPEADSPATLAEYAKKFHAGSNWDHYSGSLKDSLAVQKAFNVFRGDKMNHASVVLLRSAPNTPWLRLDGFMSPDDIIHEFERLNEL